jgi:hypothetical protein
VREDEDRITEAITKSRRNTVEMDSFSELSIFDNLPPIGEIESVRNCIRRLTSMIKLLDGNKRDFFNILPQKELKTNLEYFSNVFNFVLSDERKFEFKFY